MDKKVLFLSQIENIYETTRLNYLSRYFNEIFILLMKKWTLYYVPLVFRLLIDKSVNTYQFVFYYNYCDIEKCNTLGFSTIANEG